jgi:peptide deformylase
MVLRITQYGEPVLRQRGKTITRFDASIAAFARDLFETMVAGDGIGLAAPQVGKSLHFFVVDLRSRTSEAEIARLDGKPIPPALLLPLVVANSKMEYLPGETASVEEGCLSFPGIRGNVARPLTVRLSYQDAQGLQHVLEATGLLARVLQHEYDHVEGVLFIDRMDPQRVEELEPKLKQLKRETRAALKSATPAK